MEDLKEDEGVKYEIYLDHLGYPTFGIGHLILETDPEYGQPVGTMISEERVQQAFEAEIEWVKKDCCLLFPDFADKDPEVQLIIANMMFNMGRTRLSKFKRFIKAINEHKYNVAGDEMIDSNWYRQVTNRAERLCQRIIAIK